MQTRLPRALGRPPSLSLSPSSFPPSFPTSPSSFSSFTSSSPLPPHQPLHHLPHAFPTLNRSPQPSTRPPSASPLGSFAVSSISPPGSFAVSSISPHILRRGLYTQEKPKLTLTGIDMRGRTVEEVLKLVEKADLQTSRVIHAWLQVVDIVRQSPKSTKQQVKDDPRFQALAHAVEKRVSLLSRADLGKAWRCADYMDSSALDALIEATIDKAETLSPRELHETWRTIASLSIPSIPLAKALFHQAEQQVQSFDVPDIVWMLHFVAKWKREKAPHKLLDDLCEQLLTHVDQLRPKELAILLYSLNELSYTPNSDFLDQVCTHICQQGGFLKPADIASLLSNLAKFQYMPSPDAMECLARETAQKAAMFTSDELGFTLESWAKLQYQPEHAVLTNMSRAIVEKASSFRPLAMARVMSSFEAFEHDPGNEVVNALCKAAVTRRTEFQRFSREVVLDALYNLGYTRHSRDLRSVFQGLNDEQNDKSY